jgi:hypothetical protein
MNRSANTSDASSRAISLGSALTLLTSLVVRHSVISVGTSELLTYLLHNQPHRQPSDFFEPLLEPTVYL